jgi:hypothetical protein
MEMQHTQCYTTGTVTLLWKCHQGLIYHNINVKVRCSTVSMYFTAAYSICVQEASNTWQCLSRIYISFPRLLCFPAGFHFIVLSCLFLFSHTMYTIFYVTGILTTTHDPLHIENY